MMTHGLHRSEAYSNYERQSHRIETLVNAIKDNNLEAVKTLIKLDSDLLHVREVNGECLMSEDNSLNDGISNTLLHLAVMEGNFEIVKFLCKHKELLIEVVNQDLCTPIHLSCQRLHTENYNERIVAFDEGEDKPSYYKITEFLVNKAFNEGKQHILKKKDNAGISILDLAWKYSLPELGQITRKGYKG